MSATELREAIEQLTGLFIATASQRGSEALDLEEVRCLEKRSIAREPATESMLAEAERDLELDLPDVYREFVCLANGILIPDVAGFPVWMYPVDKVAPANILCPELIAFWAEFGNWQEFAPIARVPFGGSVVLEDLPDAILLADALALCEPVHESGGLFLVPFRQRGFPDWEIWLIEPHAGCSRFPRFIDFLQFECERLKANYGD